MRHIAFAVAILAFLTGCGPGSSNASNGEVDRLQIVVDSLRTRLAKVEYQNVVSSFENVALLKPSDDGYSTLKTDYGLLTVSIKNVEPYADGSRVLLTFGNTTAATLSGVSYVVDWGQVDAQGLPIENETRSKEVTAAKNFRSGSWNNATIMLEQTPPSALGFVRVKALRNKGIVLSVAR